MEIEHRILFLLSQDSIRMVPCILINRLKNVKIKPNIEV